MKIQHLLLAALLLAVPLAAEDAFTLAVVPDAQQETSGTRFNNRMAWLVSNRAALNLKAMFQVGDLQNWDTPDHAQYVHQSAGIGILDSASLPYVMCLGNHDTAAVKEGGSAAPGNVNTNLRNTTTYNAFYPVSRFTMQRGVYEAGKIDNAWHTFSAGGLDWLVINLELWARTGAVDWAKGVVAAHPNHNVIFVTHAHLDGGSGIQQNNGGYGNNSPQYVFDQAMKPYANVRLVFSGHAGVHAYRTDVGTNGNTIYQFKQCYHSNTDNPTRLFTIDTRAGTIRTWVYGQTSNTTYSDGSAFTVSGVSWVKPAAVKPAITTQPVGKTVNAGQAVSFSVVASGSAPLTYQWKRGGTVVGGNSATLSLASAQAADAGSYTCTVSNSAGSATSNAAVLTVNVPSGAGWQASYYDNRDFTGTRVQRTDATIAFAWGSGAPVAGIGADTFSVRWRGMVTAPASGTWTFTATADDGVRVWVGGRRIIDRWIDQSAAEVTGQADLAAGVATEVVMEYFENSGNAVAKLDWSGPGQARAAVRTTASGGGDDLPGGWSQLAIGAPSRPGSMAEAGGTWTITASGADIWNTADGGTMARRTVAGDVRITAKVLAVGDSNAWAKAGVMIRESGAAGSRHAFTCVTPRSGVAFQRRLATGGTSSHTAGTFAAAPYWVRVERIGNLLIGSCSPDGTTWTEIRRETIAMASEVQVGLAVTAHDDAATCTATFANVSIVAATPVAN